VVVGVDFSSAQVAAARSRHPDLRFDVADASALPFADASVDAVVCGFGMLHFPDALAAAVEARRVLVPGGRFAFTVWDQPERAVAMGAVQAAIRAHGAPSVSVPPGPDFFGLSDPRRSEQLLLDAGFREPVVEQIPQVWSLATADHVVDAFQRATVRMRALLQAQSPEQLGRIRAAVRESLEPYRRGDGYELPMPALLTIGTKPV
jgi:ubiquinone/menaquinone biosynthesis C-methylase UbiE